MIERVTKMSHCHRRAGFESSDFPLPYLCLFLTGMPALGISNGIYHQYDFVLPDAILQVDPNVPYIQYETHFRS
jgi:hypothetical protein